MLPFSKLIADVAVLRAQIDELITDDQYSVEEVSEKAVKLHKLLQTQPEDGTNSDDYRLFLTDHLQWLTIVIDKLQYEKTMLAESILQSQRRRKAQKLYGENK
ncbi:hypothetical protein [Arsukibacterium sp.]|uniref:hypothetical protein n=1 Tax=Arsukibacterium sp. TaxID=1977258 RepID=UPI00299D09AC|nr:hypothetical protein [Arsukibacterium sp.]MDX1677262.1 hypothetical protein [Arsukibacterium sp.]